MNYRDQVWRLLIFVLCLNNCELATEVANEATIEALADEFVYAHDSYTDDASTTKAIEGDPVKTIKSKSNALFGGKFIYKDDTSPNFLTNEVPSQPDGGYPKYHEADGGFVHLYNGLNISYAMKNQFSPDKPAVGEFFYVCRLYLSTQYEAILSGYGAPELKVTGTNTLQFSNNDGKTSAQAFSGPYSPMETVIFHFVYETGKVHIDITDKNGDLRPLVTLSIDPTSFFRNLGIGTSSHPMTHDFFAYIMKFGSIFSLADRRAIIKELKSKYPVGKKPNAPIVLPVLTATGTIITANLNFRANPLTGSGFDAAASTIRWYLIDNIGSTTGNGLDAQKILKTSAATDLTLDIASFSASFTSPASSKRNGLAIDVEAIDLLGNKFSVPLTSAPLNGFY